MSPAWRGGKAPLPWRPDFAAAPLLASVREAARRLVATPEAASGTWPGLARLNALAEATTLVNAAGLPIRFVPQDTRHGQRDYEARILASGQVPTRAGNWHDLLNALAWLSYPHTKAVLNAMQCAALSQTGGGNRCPLSDALTLFDESGLLLLSRDGDIARLLRARQWREVFWERRDAWQSVRCHVIGHALLEQALAPFPGMTAKCLSLEVASLPPPGGPLPADLDVALAEHWRAGHISRPGDLFAVPVLGIPGICPDNEHEDFYQRAEIFRAPRMQHAPARIVTRTII